MGDWPILSDGGPSATYGVSGTGFVTVTCGSPNTKGAYAEIASATGFIATEILVQIKKAGNTTCLVDIAIGAAGSEIDIISNLLVDVTNTSAVGLNILIPIRVPAGIRISARAQDSNGVATLQVGCTLSGQGFLPSSAYQRVTTYGALTASSKGTVISPGYSGAEGAWTQIVASCNPIRNLVVLVGQNAGGKAAGNNYLVDIGIGAAGAEIAIISDLYFTMGAGAQVLPMVFGPFPVNIPAATRLSVRGQDAAASSGTFGAVLYGVD